MTDPLSTDLLERMDAYWRAANYLSVGQIYLRDNPLLKQKLTLGHVPAGKGVRIVDVTARHADQTGRNEQNGFPPPGR